MLRILWGLTRGYRLRPWKSPYLRWRIETYWGLHSGEITFAQFWTFAWRRRHELLRYLRWADRMIQHPAVHSASYGTLTDQGAEGGRSANPDHR